MNRERGFMRLLKDQLLHLMTLGNHQAVPKVNNTSFIHRETTSYSLGDIFLDSGDSRIMLLDFYDMIHKSRLRHQGRKEFVRSNVKIKLTEFLMEKWLALLQHKIVAIGLTT